MLQRVIDRIETRYPWLTHCLGGRLDLQLPALSGSLIVHLLLLAFVGTLSYAVSAERDNQLHSEVLSTYQARDFAMLEPTEVASIDEPLLEPSMGSFGPEVSPMIFETPPVEQVAVSGARSPRNSPDGTAPAALEAPELVLDNRFALPQATRLGDSVSIRGTGAEHVGETEGAIDRIAIEILRKLEKNRTLVVWAFDASYSLQSERQRLAKYLAGVYAHIESLDRDGLAANDALLSSVIAFGKSREVLAEPTTDVAALTTAILQVKLDDSGVESTFQTVADVAKRYGRFQKDDQRYQVMMVVVTDEVGDDEDRLEPAITAARAVAMPVHVLGSPALFGRLEGYMDFKDPKTGFLYRNLPVRAGPESVLPEVVRLPFWYNGPQYDFLDSGFGPWALSRLCRQTGGIYFITRLTNAAGLTFDPLGMREYAPDWDSQAEFQQRLARSPLRQAVLQAAHITQQNLPGMPSLTFPAAESPDFKEAMAQNQELAARVSYTVDEALVPINAALQYRDREPSRRWRAHYDLVRGRLLAVKIRCFEYNAICAKMKKEMPRFTKEKSNAWRLLPSGDVQSNAKAAEAAQDARQLLQQVVQEHPGTPWALLAQRELKDPFGLDWAETYVPPPPPRSEPDAAAKKKAQNRPEMNPPPPPRL